MPHYRTEGKLLEPMTDADFVSGMNLGKFCSRKHKGYCVGLYYTALRKLELGNALKEQFQITGRNIMFEVGQRLKHSMKTPPLVLPLDAPFMAELVFAIQTTEKGKRIWPYSPKTFYNIVRRVYHYPHYFRLSRITNFFLEGWTIAQVRSWTGLSLQALNYYVGLVDIAKMGQSLAKKVI